MRSNCWTTDNGQVCANDDIGCVGWLPDDVLLIHRTPLVFKHHFRGIWSNFFSKICITNSFTEAGVSFGYKTYVPLYLKQYSAWLHESDAYYTYSYHTSIMFVVNLPQWHSLGVGKRTPWIGHSPSSTCRHDFYPIRDKLFRVCYLLIPILKFLTKQISFLIWWLPFVRTSR